MPMKFRFLCLCLLTASLVAAGGCSVNPVTGQSDFVLMSEDQEISLGRQNHPKILQQYGSYDLKKLQDYVQQVGERLAKNSHRSNLIYRFTVLDSPDVNAFALPGGYIYVTRGLMAYLKSEAELAAVLGHEIGHVTARHAVRQHSAATATSIIGAVIASQTGVQGAGDLLNVIGSAIVRGYGREHELESDRLGAEYLARSGYDPQAMIEVIRVLKNQELFEKQLAKEEEREPRVYHGVFASHPDNDKRLQQVVGQAHKFKVQHPVRNHQRYMKLLNGVVFGDSEKQGILRGRNFYHKDLDFTLTFPQHWKIDNLPDVLIARPPRGDGFLQMSMQDLNKRISPREFILQRMNLDNLQRGENFQHAGMSGYTAVAHGRSPFGNRLIRVTVLYYNKSAYIFYGTAKRSNEPYKYDADFIATARSFRPLTSKERQLAKAQQLKIIKAKKGTRFAHLAKTSHINHHAEEQLRLLNRYYPKGEPQTGSLIKIVE